MHFLRLWRKAFVVFCNICVSTIVFQFYKVEGQKGQDLALYGNMLALLSVLPTLEINECDESLKMAILWRQSAQNLLFLTTDNLKIYIYLDNLVKVGNTDCLVTDLLVNYELVLFHQRQINLCIYHIKLV